MNNAIPDANGPPNPMPKSSHPNTIPNMYATGTRINTAEAMLFNSENIVCPAPMNNPLSANIIGANI